MPARQSAQLTRTQQPGARGKTGVLAKAPGTPHSTPLKILVASHSHPGLTKGGAEIAAYSLHQALTTEKGMESWFLGCANGTMERRVGSCISQPFGHSEFIYHPTVPFDYFKFANRDPEFPRAIEDLMAQIQPDIVHLHHYAIFGVELLQIIKRIRPETRIVMTLHEYFAICHHHGQMAKVKTFRPCRQESLIDCGRCFPDIPAQDFFLRKNYVQNFFGHVDRFIAPSQFLARRYVAWGIPESKITVLENLLPRHAPAPPPAPTRSHQAGRNKTPRLRIGYFGQMSALKGIKVLAQAAKRLHERRIDGISFDIFGDYSNQPPDFQAEIEQILHDTDLSTNFSYHGPYENEDVHALMQSVDIVIVPSIWWENSPVVIQEALASRRPVICSNIGGMAEKVRPGLDGWHFRAGDAGSLVALLEDLLDNPKAIAQVRKTLIVPPPPEQRVREHIRLYTEVRAIQPHARQRAQPKP